MKNFKNFNPPYIYTKIAAYANEMKIELIKCDESTKLNMFQKIMNNMENFSKTNGIFINNCEINNLEDIYNNFNIIINWHKGLDGNDIRKSHLEFLRDLLFKKNEIKEVVESNFESNNEKATENFTVNDFILNYTLNAIPKIFEVQSHEDSDFLDCIYLSLLFKVNDPNFIINLKVLIYQHLYGKKDYVNFKSDSLKCIANELKFDDRTLKKFIMQNGEFDELDIKEVSENVKSFFNKKNEVNDLLNFFTAKNIQNNYNNFEKLKSEGILREYIAVDTLKYDKNKIHLFSPEFLISNGLKSKIELNDIEIFNEDNYRVDIFAEFITEIIDNINNSIKENNFSTDFIKKNLIKLNEQEFNHYISAKLEFAHIKELRFSNLKNFETNNVINIKLKNKEKKKIEEKTKIEEDINIKSNNSNEEEISFLRKTLMPNFNKKYTNFVEEIIELGLTNFIEKQNLIYLPNILFMLNLKIPKINNNLLEFKSIHLDFFNDEKKYINSNIMYGCKEIDTIFKNNSKITYEFNDSNFYSVNLAYIREKGKKQFESISEEKILIRPNSIIFSEIRRSFPNSGRGNENILIAKIKDCPKKRDCNILDLDEEDRLFPYLNQLIKLIKKFQYFFNTFKEIKNQNELTIQIIFIYNTYNMKEERIGFQNIKNLIKNILDYYYGCRINNIGTTIVQLVFFDNFQLEIEKEKIYLNRKKIVDQKEIELKNAKDELKNTEDELEINKQILEKIKEIINDANLTQEEIGAKIDKLLKGRFIE